VKHAVASWRPPGLNATAVTVSSWRNAPNFCSESTSQIRAGVRADGSSQPFSVRAECHPGVTGERRFLQFRHLGAAKTQADQEAQEGKANRVAGNPLGLSSGANRKAPRRHASGECH
jgi:hypothetical protein